MGGWGICQVLVSGRVLLLQYSANLDSNRDLYLSFNQHSPEFGTTELLAEVPPLWDARPQNLNATSSARPADLMAYTESRKLSAVDSPHIDLCRGRRKGSLQQRTKDHRPHNLTLINRWLSLNRNCCVDGC